MFTLKVFNKYRNKLVFIKEHISKNDIDMYINRQWYLSISKL